jgi:hypothetical protein
MDKNTVLIQISYEIICEADLILPKKAYLELLDQPEKIIPCTLRDEIANKNNIEKLDSKTLCPGYNGINIKIKIVKKKVMTGDKKKINKFELEGIMISFINNFKPSANGCKKPSIPVRLGPFLL